MFKTQYEPLSSARQELFERVQFLSAAVFLDWMDPVAEYSSRLGQRQQEREQLQKRFVQIGNVRLAIGIAFAALCWAVFGSPHVPATVLLLPVVAFVPLAVWHAGVLRSRELRDRAVRFYESGLARVEGRWENGGPDGSRFRVKDHVYADDLDVFGPGSLFALISRARTSMGENTLASWLLQPAAPEEAQGRQGAVTELASALDLREDIALLGADVRAEMDPNRLLQWASAEPERFAPFLWPLAFLLAVISVAAVVLFFLLRVRLTAVALVLALDAVFIYALRQRVERVFEGLARASRDLQILALLLRRMERESFACARMQEISGALRIEGEPASKRIAKLARRMDYVDSSDHALVRAMRPLVLWKEQCAFAVDRWRCENGEYIARWLKAVGDFEALSSLASLAFEHPQWSMPELRGGADPCFAAKALRHPLLPDAACVPNDVALGGELRLLIISGSNMSGKSTLLRSIGLNAVLAWAGAPVAADGLTISRLQVGASLRVADSLQDNRSRFFAEITRLRSVLELTEGAAPVLFLLDELLSGTNSHDRRLGAAAVVKTLVERGALGCVTTHDLALAEMERDLGKRAANAHFADQLRDGVMSFDYKLQPGIVTHSNALELMRAVGLPV